MKINNFEQLGGFNPFIDESILVSSVQNRWCDPSMRSYDPSNQRLYLDSHVRALLAKPESPEKLYLNNHGSEFYNAKLLGDRYTFPLSGSSSPDLEVWYPQGFEPTCGTWAFTNGLTALGIRPESQLIRQLLNRSICDLTNKSNAGISLRTLKGIGETHPDPRYTFGDITTNFSDVLTYARFLKTVLDHSGTIIETVSSEFYGMQNDIHHAVAIVGYLINKSGEMDLKVIDSNQGILPLSCDFLDRVRTGGALPIVRTGFS